METDKDDDEKKKKKGKSSFWRKSIDQKILNWLEGFLFLCSAPKCGFIKSNEKILVLLEQVKPEIVAFREAIIVVSFRTWWIDERF